MKMSQVAVLASVALGAAVMQAGSASAVPMIDTGPAAVAHSELASGIQDVRWHDGWHRPWHRGPHGWHRPFGWHHPWGWRHHGWHHRHWR